MKRFAHARRGTCNDQHCPFFSKCHCGCGETATFQPWNKGQGRVAGGFSIWVQGHNNITEKGLARKAELKRLDGDRPFKRLPAAPLRPLIKAAAIKLAVSENDKGHLKLAKRFAERYSMDFDTAKRMMWRILDAKTASVMEDTADLWCCFLGTHLDLVYDNELFEDAKERVAVA